MTLHLFLQKPVQYTYQYDLPVSLPVSLPFVTQKQLLPEHLAVLVPPLPFLIQK
jgi:hypothetical protein